eukprot:6475544-Amphidinium_carterae.1
MADDITLVLALDSKAVVVPGKPLAGSTPLKLDLKGTKIDMSPLLLSDDKLAAQVCNLSLVVSDCIDMAVLHVLQ